MIRSWLPLSLNGRVEGDDGLLGNEHMERGEEIMQKKWGGENTWNERGILWVLCWEDKEK